jgi:hypothetical protein
MTDWPCGSWNVRTTAASAREEAAARRRAAILWAMYGE